MIVRRGPGPLAVEGRARHGEVAAPTLLRPGAGASPPAAAEGFLELLRPR